jgi:hypothetical protein
MRIEQEAVFGMAEPSAVVSTVRLLHSRMDFLGGALEYAKDTDDALPLESERRILQATLAAIKAEYAPGYFDEALRPCVSDYLG